MNDDDEIFNKYAGHGFLFPVRCFALNYNSIDDSNVDGAHTSP